jgi:hypothetical protein
MLNSKENKKLIPLKLISQEGIYSHSFLLDLARNKKLRTIEIDNSYYTSREWLLAYIGKEYNKNKLALKKDAREYLYKKEIRYSSLDKLLQGEKINQLLDENLKDNYNRTIAQKLVDEWLSDTGKYFKTIFTFDLDSMRGNDRKRNLLLNLYYLLTLEINKKTEAVKHETIKKLAPRPFSASLLSLGLLVLFVSVMIGRFSPQLTNRITTVSSQVFYSQVYLTEYIFGYLKNSQPKVVINAKIADKNQLANFIKNYSWYYKTDKNLGEATFKITDEEIVGKIAGVEETAED